MNQAIDIVLPVFGLIGIGYAAAWGRILPEGGDQALADFCYNIAIPLLIFKVVATADFSGGSPWALWAAYYFAFAVMWTAGTFLVRRLFRRDARAGLVAGVSSSYGNVLLVGVPLILSAYGDQGTAAITLLIAIHLPIMMGVSAVLIERALIVDGLSDGTHVRAIAMSVARSLLLNPVILGLFAGILWRLTGLGISGPGGTVVDRLGNVAATVALVSVGMNLRKYGIHGNVRAALIVGSLKLIVMPALVLLLVVYVVALPPVWAKAIVLAAACPTGVNAYVVASRFRTGEALSSNAITLTTALAVLTVALWLHVLAGI
ncbi:MAG: AEC family transporter [Bauldia sp.]